MDSRILLRKVKSAGVRLRRALVSQRFGFSPSAIYDAAFYDGPGCDQGKASAAAVARVLVERYRPGSLFDFGCGQGALIGAAYDLGVSVGGCEGSAHGVARCPEGALVFQADLRRPVVMNKRFDLVTCIEVAEHLPGRSETALVASIAAAAAHRIVFSASGPGELGDDHINLQPPSHWAQLFALRGFAEDRAESEHLRKAMREAGAPPWLDNAIVLLRH